MIESSQAVILKRFPYGDTSLIARCFTREFGKVSLIARGARRKKSTITAHLQPLAYLDVVFYYKPDRDLQTLSKAGFVETWNRIPKDLKKIAYGMAVLELTDKTLTDHDPHSVLFEEMVEVLRAFDRFDKKLNLVFWYYELQLLSRLGFHPDLSQTELEHAVLPNPDSSPNGSKILELLLNGDLGDKAFQKALGAVQVRAKDRKFISETIDTHLHLHFESLGKLKSLDVMKQIVA